MHWCDFKCYNFIYGILTRRSVFVDRYNTPSTQLQTQTALRLFVFTMLPDGWYAFKANASLKLNEHRNYIWELYVKKTICSFKENYKIQILNTNVSILKSEC